MTASSNTNSNIFHNTNSYYNQHKIVSNISNNIDKIYVSFDNKNSIICYKDGTFEETFDKTLKLKNEQDVLEIHMVSMTYFFKLCNDLSTIHNKTRLS
jgi:hypothetical protein